MSVETTEKTLDDLRRELQETQAAGQRLVEEQNRLELTRSEALDADDLAILQDALSGKPLRKNSPLRKVMDRLDKIPHQLYAVRRRVVMLQIEIGELELEELSAEHKQASRDGYAAIERFEEAREERDYTQSVAHGYAEDVRSKTRSIHALREQLAEHEANKPSSDLFEERLRQHGVWRW